MAMPTAEELLVLLKRLEAQILEAAAPEDTETTFKGKAVARIVGPIFNGEPITNSRIEQRIRSCNRKAEPMLLHRLSAILGPPAAGHLFVVDIDAVLNSIKDRSSGGYRVSEGPQLRSLILIDGPGLQPQLGSKHDFQSYAKTYERSWYVVLESDVSATGPVESFVYFIRGGSGGRIKIGTSANPVDRLAQLQVGCPDDLELLVAIPGSYELESRLHARFAAQHVRGEWYDPSPDLMELIARNKSLAK